MGTFCDVTPPNKEHDVKSLYRLYLNQVQDVLRRGPLTARELHETLHGPLPRGHNSGATLRVRRALQALIAEERVKIYAQRERLHLTGPAPCRYSLVTATHEPEHTT